MSGSLLGLDAIEPIQFDVLHLKFAVIKSEWNNEITNKLLEGVNRIFESINFPKSQLTYQSVPGTFELAFAAQSLAKRPDIDGVICLGCVIRGETSHYDYICQASANGIMNVSLKYSKPIIFGVLTTENIQQALDRSGGKYGNKGEEAAITLLKMSKFM